ncbi:MAG: alpha-ribazole phosphatase [Paracoccaceae bacterium]|jgi:alpha-ribazole phosphatase
MSIWWWVRHGPTHAKGFVGRTDTPADLGDLAAIDRLNSFLPVDALVISSNLKRASCTADAIAGNRQRLPHASGLQEMDFGDWEARDFKDIAKTDPEVSRAFWTDPSTATPPGGESWQQVSDRVANVVDTVIVEHSPLHVIAVAHVGVIMTQLQRAGKMPAASAMSFNIDNLSVTKLEFLNPGWRVLTVNHLP